MSAITGIGEERTISRSASTSFSRGTATRTRSAPAAATRWIWAMVALRSAVSVLVIVCTATGAPPPIGTPPTLICRLEAIETSLEAGTARPGAGHDDGAGRPRPEQRAASAQLSTHRRVSGGRGEAQEIAARGAGDRRDRGPAGAAGACLQHAAVYLRGRHRPARQPRRDAGDDPRSRRRRRARRRQLGRDRA